MTRRDDSNGDMCFGHGPGDFVYGAAEAAQCAVSRLRLQRSDWFLDTTAGVRWRETGDGSRAIFSRPTPSDAVESEIKTCLLGTRGVASLLSFDFGQDRNTRNGIITAALATVDGDIQNIRVVAQ